MHVNVFCDGACKGNPGPGGWGYYLITARFRPDDADSCRRKEGFGGSPHTTNNIMELTAALEALTFLHTHPVKNDVWEVSMFVDSRYVLDGATEWMHNWKKKNWVSVKNKELWQQLDALLVSPHLKINWTWVKGHSGNYGNDRADTLANMGVPK